MPPRALLRPHHGLLTISLVGALLLLATSISSHREAQTASRLVIQGQAETLDRAIRAAIQQVPVSELDEESLRPALERWQDEGLRYLAVFDHSGALLAEAGTAQGAHTGAPDRPGLEIELRGDRVHSAMRPPGRGPRGRGGRRGRPPARESAEPAANASIAGPPGDGPPQPPGAAPPDRRRGDHRPETRPGHHEFEFEPIVALQLRSAARRGALVSLAGVLMLGLATWLLWRQTRAREAAEEAAQRDRHLAQLGQMAATMSHELRTPLTSLKGHAQLLAASLPEGSRQRQKASDLVGDVVRLQSLSEGLLRFARSGRAEPVPTDPRVPLEQALADEGLQLVPVVRGRPSPRRLDPIRLRQALGNLLRNARQATGEENGIEALLEVHPTRLVYRVRDRGPGLPEGAVEQLFAPFVTHTPSGTGLGLALARQIARAHEGDLTAHDRAGGGAEFVLTLPCSDLAAAGVQP